jgi:hypothetical protein
MVDDGNSIEGAEKAMMFTVRSVGGRQGLGVMQRRDCGRYKQRRNGDADNWLEELCL